jgi:sulfatase modifying factor 1
MICNDGMVTGRGNRICILSMQVKTLLLLFAWLGGVTNLAAQEIIRPRMVSIPAGRFRMGAAGSGEAADQSPVHEVTISHPFFLSATEITNEQYEAFDPGHRKFRGRRGFSKEDDEAVVYIRYSDAVAYCAWLSAREHRLFRLPTEAEWEYACRAGTHTRYYAGDTLPAIDQKEQHDGRDPVPVSLRVGTNAPNPWGLYDMHGNVEEWCLDWYGPYTAALQTDPAGYGSGTARVTRGEVTIRRCDTSNRQRGWRCCRKTGIG